MALVTLLDVNFLIALFDGTHLFHETAHRHFAELRSEGWATCPLTENGFVRVISSSSYPGRRTEISDALDRLSAFCASGGHEFWPDSVSLLDYCSVNPRHLLGPRQLTDVYLLALATSRRGRLATFDRAIPLAAAVDSKPENLLALAG